MKILHIFTEEPSIKEVFKVLLPKLLPENSYFRIYPHQGKQDLEKAITTTIPSISKIPGSRIIIVIDQDAHDCCVLKEQIMQSINSQCACPFKVRIVCRELESWFLGDLQAIQQAYHRFKAEQYASKANFRNVDAIVKPSFLLKKIVPEYAEREFLPKLEVAEKIAPFMNVQLNNSLSFQHMVKAIAFLAVSEEL